MTVHPLSSSLSPSLNRRPQPHSIHYSRMFCVAGETNSCWGKKSLKVIDLAPPKVNLTLTRFEGPRGACWRGRRATCTCARRKPTMC